MKKTWKRLVASCLALCLMLTLVPASLALETDTQDDADEPVVLLDAEEVQGTYTTWDSAPVLTAGQTISVPLTTYYSGFADPQVWFAVNLKKGEAVQMDVSQMSNSVYLYAFSEAALRSNGGPSNDIKSYFWNYFSKDTTRRFKAVAEDTYYFMMRPYSSSSTTETEAKIAISLVEGDLHDSSSDKAPNDSWDTAAELTCNVNTYYNLNGANDQDWFKFTTVEPGQAVKLVFSNFNYTVDPVSAEVYSEKNGDLTKLGSLTGFSKDSYYCYKFNEPGDYYVKIVPQNSGYSETRMLKLRYELIDGDQYEINDTYQQATPIPFAYDMEFTLNGINDEDWFYFETSLPNEVVHLNLSGFDTDYSNKIIYYVYDATETGYNSKSVVYAYVDITHTKTIGFTNTGGHYIRVIHDGGMLVENTLKLRIEQGVVDEGEPNDTWQTATPIAEGVAQSFKLPSTADKDFFQFTTTKPNQTVEVTLEIPSGGYVHTYLYSEANFETNGDGARSLTDWTSGVGTSTMRYMLGEVGTYELKILPYNSEIFEEDAKVTYRLIDPDENEENPTWKTATVLNESVDTKFTLPASNDSDWFKFSTTAPNQTVEVTLHIPSGGYVHTYLYSEANFETNGDGARLLTDWVLSAGTSTMRYMLGEAGNYELKIVPYNGKIFDDDATVTYRLIEPDENEGNPTWKTATTLNESVSTSFNFPASNDCDWFKFNTTEANQTVEVTLNIPDGGSVHTYLYSEANFETNGDGARSLTDWVLSAGTSTMRYMLGEAGNYELKIVPYDGRIFDADATVTYRLIGADGNELNNEWGSATELHAQTAAYYTLPASNDYDWFKLDPVTPGDKVTVTFGDVKSGQNTIRAYLSVVKTGEVNAVNVGDYYINRTLPVSSYTWTAQAEGDYYLRVHSGGWIPNQMYLRYAITRDDVDVTGVTLSNGGTTIFQGKTLQLYANIQPANATNQSVTWKSSATGVATVDENGIVTGVAPGSTTITATTADGGFSASATITVAAPIPVTGVTVTAGNVEHKGETAENPLIMAQDTSVQLTATVLPEGATEQAVTWSVDDPNVLAVTDYGKIYAIGSGSAVVTVTTVEGNYTANFWVSVPDETYPVNRIVLDQINATLYMGEEGTQLKANVYPSYATNPGMRWSSDNEAVATVDQTGFVTQVSEGYATITVTAVENPAITATCSIAVKPARIRVTGISFPSDTITLGLYGTTKLQPVIAPVDATDQSVTWSTDNKTVATVSRTGEVTAMGFGKAIITATTVDGAHVATVKVTVALTAGWGDVNNDGDTDVADALMVLRANVGLMALNSDQQVVADVNGDNYVDPADAILILRYNAGLIDSFPVEKKA